MLSTVLTYGGAGFAGAIVWHFLSGLWTAIKTRASADVTQLKADAADLKSRVAALEAGLQNPTAPAKTS